MLMYICIKDGKVDTKSFSYLLFNSFPFPMALRDFYLMAPLGFIMNVQLLTSSCDFQGLFEDKVQDHQL